MWPAHAQESPYFVTYDHYLEEPGSLEVEYFSTFGTQRAGNSFHSFWAEFEYGATAWWTTEFYLDGQSTFGDGTIFTGFRWENRVRLLDREHFVNPVLYVEYEQIGGADKILKEVEGHDIESDYAAPNAVARLEPRSRTGNQAHPLQNIQGMECSGKYHRNQESHGRRSLGVRLCPRRQPAVSAQGLGRTLQLLPREFHRRSRDVRRAR